MVGEIDAVGTGVDPALVGRRVLVDPVIRQSPEDLLSAAYLGSDCDGGFAELVVVPASNIIDAPEGIDDAQAATLATAGGTAMRMIRRGGFSRGDQLLVTGASGGVGTALVQLATKSGCEVTAVTRRQDVVPWLETLGASRVVHPGNLPQDVVYDGVLDVVAGENAGRLLGALRRGGTYVVAGASGGPRFSLDVRTVYLGQLSMVGTSLFTYEDLRLLLASVASGTFQPVLDSTFPLNRLSDAQRRFASGDCFGNVVVTVAGAA